MRQAQLGIVVTGEVVTGTGVQALLARCEDAVLIVVGDRGLGAFTGLLVGSVAIRVSSHATGPVLVARRVADEGLPVLLPRMAPQAANTTAD